MGRVFLRGVFVSGVVIFLFMICTVSAQTNTSEAGCININKATVEELQTLPGIGPIVAQRIVKHRENIGPFNSIEELKNIRGIGERRFELIKDKVCIE